MTDDSKNSNPVTEAARKPMLTPEQLVEHLKSKGVAFELCSEAEAAAFLRSANNYLRAASYRKLYDRQTEGDRIGDYINLDFGHLVALSSLDRKLRETMLDTVVDIEHFAKMAVLERAQTEDEDGYAIVSDYIASLGHNERNRLQGGFSSRSRQDERHDTYTGDLIASYEDDMPLWVFLEVVEFGRFVDFYRFCSGRWNDRKMNVAHYVLKSVKAMRNACAHNSCILNGLSAAGESAGYSTPTTVTDFLNQQGIKNTKSRKSKLKNLRIAQIAAVLQSDAEFCLLPSTKARHAESYEKLSCCLADCADYACLGNDELASYIIFIKKGI